MIRSMDAHRERIDVQRNSVLPVDRTTFPVPWDRTLVQTSMAQQQRAWRTGRSGDGDGRLGDGGLGDDRFSDGLGDDGL